MVTKHFVLIVNPRSGRRRGLAVVDGLRPFFASAAAGLAVHITASPGHARQIAETVDLAGCDGLCVAGGDGTIHEVVDGLMRRGDRRPVPLGVIPCGTGNTVSEHLHCTDPVEAAARVVAGRTVALDLLRVTTPNERFHCVNLVGWGVIPDINHTANRLRFLGGRCYAAAALWQILKPIRRRARLLLDGQAVEDDFLFVLACNTKFAGASMMVAPGADIADGKVDVVLLRSASRFQMLRLFSRVFDGSYVSLGYTEHRQVRSFAIFSEGREWLDLDGELKGTAPASVEVIPAALRVFAR